MSRIFWGFFFISFNFNITSGNSVIGLLPDFVGYILIYQGITGLQNLSSTFGKIKNLVLVMVFLKVIAYMLDVFGINQLNSVSIIFGVVLLVMTLYIQYSIVRGIQEMEQALTADLNAEKLMSLWKIVAVCSTLAYITVLIPSVAILFVLISCVANMVFLYNVWQSKKAYEQRSEL